MKNIITILAFLIILSGQTFSQWELCNNGIQGGKTKYASVYGLALSGSKILAGVFRGGVIASTDNGQTWSQSNNGLEPNSSVNCFAMSGTDIFGGSEFFGVCMSSDNGQNWTKKNNGLLDSSIHSLAVRGNYIYAGTYNGVYISSDKGDNWIYSGLDSHTITGIIFIGNDIFVSTGCSGVYVSTDNGLSWTMKNNGLKYLSINCLASDGLNMYAGTRYGLYLSTDKGGSWTNVSSVSANVLLIKDSSLYAGSDGGLIMSTDKGVNWTRKWPDQSMGVHSLLVNGDNIFAGTYGAGLYLSTDKGESWDEKTGGYSDINIQCLAADGEDVYAASLEEGILKSTDYGSKWNKSNTGLSTDKLSINFIKILGSHIYAGTYQSGLIVSSDRGSSWEKQSMNGSIDIAASGDYLYLTTGSRGGIFGSSDRGANWSLDIQGLSSMRVFCLEAKGESIFGGTEHYGIIYSDNTGESWNGIGLPDTTVISMALSGSKIFAGTLGHGIYFSDDNGDNWQESGLNGESIRKIAVNRSGFITVATDHGFFLSTNEGISWKHGGLSDIQLPERLTSIAINETWVFAGIDYKGVYRARISDLLSGVGDNQESSGQTRVYPNPATGVLHVSNSNFSGREIKIYDMTGNVLLTKAADSSEMRIDIESLAKGAYLIRAGQETAVFVKE